MEEGRKSLLGPIILKSDFMPSGQEAWQQA